MFDTLPSLTFSVLTVTEECFCLFFLLFQSFLSDAQQVCSSEKHFLHYKFTALSKANTFPEFSAVCVCDHRQIKHYSNENKSLVRESWTEDDWINAPAEPRESRDWFLHQMKTLLNCSDSQCSELHVLQRLIGCELEKLPDGSVNLRAFDEYGFDGEDFIAFDSETLQWIDKNPKAKETKMKWDQQTRSIEHLQHFLKTCTDWISTFNNTNTSSPDVHIFARKAPDDHSKLNLSCLATGFYPRDIEMNIRLNRTVLENQTSSGIRPNDDRSFQMRTSVKIDRYLEELYDCLVNHSSLTEPVSVKWEGHWADCETQYLSALLIAGLVVSALVQVLIVVICCIYRKKTSSGQMCSYGDIRKKERKKERKKKEASSFTHRSDEQL